VTEIGRQRGSSPASCAPDAAGEASGAQLGASLTAYLLTYSALLLSYMIVLTHLAGKGGGRRIDERRIP